MLELWCFACLLKCVFTLVAVIYHVAILMPTREKDPKCNAKKLHIGNDYVTIVYNESGAEYKIGTIKVGPVCVIQTHVTM